MEGTNVSEAEKEMFQDCIESMFFDYAEIELRAGHYGLFGRVTNVSVREVEEAVERFEKMDYGYAVIETGEGIGIEIWSDLGE